MPENETESSQDLDTDVPQPNVPTGYDHPWLQEFFRPGFIGPQRVPDDISGHDLFKLFLTDEVINICVVETNQYAANFIATHNIPPHSRAAKWIDTTPAEMRAFLGLLLLTGISKRSSFELYCSTDPLIDMKGFLEIMSMYTAVPSLCE